MKKLASLIITFLLVFSLVACTQNSSQTELSKTPHTGYILTPGVVCTVDDTFSYEVINYFGDNVSAISKAESLVRDWWNDDETFHTPEFVWVTIHTGDIRGFQDPGYIFLDPNTSFNDLLATIVHEWLHELVAPSTLIDLERNGYGRPVMEMVVESITVDIMKSYPTEPTQNYLYFKETPELWNHKAELESAFRAQQDFSAYEKILGEDYQKIIAEATIALT